MSTNPFQTLGYSYRKDFSLVKFSSEFMKSRISYCKVYFVEYKANTCTTIKALCRFDRSQAKHLINGKNQSDQKPVTCYMSGYRV